METYEQKYERALKQAKKELEACGSLDCDTARQIFRLFPELQSIKNERIKNNIIKFLRFVRDTYHQYSDECNEAINWFENNPMFDMSKIKFKVGDWVIFKCGTPESVYKVEKIENYAYTLRHILGGSMSLPFGSQNFTRPWTIQDAKDGDILTTRLSPEGDWIGIFKGRTRESFTTYCFLASDGEFVTNINRCKQHGIQGIHPATKEQRDLLFQKMKEAGYKWDDIKKELIRED